MEHIDKIENIHLAAAQWISEDELVVLLATKDLVLTRTAVFDQGIITDGSGEILFNAHVEEGDILRLVFKRKN